MNTETKNLENVLWEGADILRSKMDANEYKNYLLPIVFFKYLSDKNLSEAFKLISFKKENNLEVMQEEFEKAKTNNEVWSNLTKELKKEYHYFLEPELTFTYLVDKIKKNKFQREDLGEAVKSIESCDKIFENLFADLDLYSNRLGSTEQKQSQTIIDIMLKFNVLNLNNYTGDAIGDAYEYLIGQFASETGKKAGEFYTPKAVSDVLTRVAISGQENLKGLTVYDPAMGSGSLLLDGRKYSNYPKHVRHYGQEIMISTFNLARMNMMLHGISPENQILRNGDTLDADWPTTEENLFDMVVMNPPYSLNWSAAQGFKTDPRFRDYGGNLPPKSKADYAFLLHGFYHLKNTGTMAIVLPHGVLFRGSSEGKIRKILCEKGSIYAIIGLPSNLFYNTGIPTVIIVLKKNREVLNRDILFIDASKEFKKNKKQNMLTEEHINNILEMYSNRVDVDKHAHLASFKEIESNDFNLNIPRYVDTFEEEEDINIGELVDSLNDTDNEISTLTKEFYTNLLDLTSEDDNLKSDISKLAKLFEGEI